MKYQHFDKLYNENITKLHYQQLRLSGLINQFQYKYIDDKLVEDNPILKVQRDRFLFHFGKY